jgi:hypothetical protein
MRVKTIWMILLLAWMLSSCATIFGGKKNTVKIAGSPVEAEIYLDNIFLGTTPFEERISKYKLQEGSLLEIRKPGYESEYYEVLRRPHVGYIVLNIFSGSIPLIVDVATGNIYRPNTRNVSYQLVKVDRSQAMQSEDLNNKEVKE